MWIFLLLANFPTYKEVKPIFKNRCSECHDSMKDKNWQNYDTAYKFRYQIKEKLITREMPPVGTISDDERKQLISWVDGGAKP